MGARILVADDSVTIQKVVELTFSKEDFILTQARSGDETIRKAREVRPDLVLLDIVMPDMNGYDVCAALRAEPALRSVPIILLAGTFESFDQRRGAQVGANDFVTKPFESQVLIGKVKQLLFARAMEADRATDSARPSGHAVTVRIPPAHSAVSTPHSDTVTATDTPSQPAPSDALRQAPGATPAVPPLPTPSEPFAEFAAETAASERSAAETHDPALDLSSIELEPVPTPTDAGADALDVLPLPESLSLDELLGVGADAPLATLSASPPEPDTPASEPVFELTESDAPPLPMVEAGTGEPPALAVEHLLGTGAAAPEDTLTLELPELDLTALSGVPSSLPAEDTVFGPTPSEATAEPAEVLGVDPSAAERAAAAMETMFAPVPPDVALLGDAAEVVPGAPEPGLSDKPFELAGARAEELSVAAPEVAAGAGAPSPGASGAFAPEEMAAMRDAVTARVADELRHELNEKLLERFEKIVWEVVPDLAEILITKEIERIRRLADEERKS